MNDLGIAVGILLALASLLFRLGISCGRTARCALLVTALALSITLGGVAFLHGRLFIANWFPFSNIIVLSNLLPLEAAFLAGVLQTCGNIPGWRRVLLSTCLLVAGWLSVVWSTASPAEVTPLHRYLNGVCIQSVPNSCSACSAVTLLGHYGIMADEAEMAQLCLTNGRGTQLLGIYRGLKLKTAHSPFDVEVVQCDFDELLAVNRFPIMAPLKENSSGFDPLSDVAPNLMQRLRNWLADRILEADHCVVLYGLNDDGVMVVGDPSNVINNPVGRRSLDIRQDWLGVGFRIVRRDAG